jgi:hypothetical protein
MVQRKWFPEINGVSHQVVLKDNLIQGREIWVNDLLIEKTRVLMDRGSEHHFLIDGHRAELGVVPAIWRFDHYLQIDDQLIPQNKDRGSTTSKAVKRKLEERKKWTSFQKKHELEYFPLMIKPFIYQHRLIGHIKNHLVLIMSGFQNIGEASIPGIYIFIKHANIDSEKIKEIKKDQELIKFLKKSKAQAGSLEITPEVTILFLRKTKESVEIIIERLLTFTSMVSTYLKPGFRGKCEGIGCKLPIGQDLQLITINNLPFMMCQDCINNIKTVNLKAEEDYRQLPNNLFTGFVYGLAGMLLGAILWALVFIFLNSIGAIFAIATFFIIVKAMDLAKTKRSFISFLLAAILALAGSVIGAYLGVAGYLIKEHRITINLEDLINVAQGLLQDREIINESIFFSLLGIVPYLFMTWNAHRKGLESAFRPEVEIISRSETESQRANRLV